MKKIKLAAGIAALATLTTSMQAFALECTVSTSLTDTQQIITLDITGDNTFENIAVRILKPGSQITADTTLEEIREMLVAGTTVTTDADMKASRSFTLPANLEAGDYIIDLKTDSNAELHPEYFLYGFDELDTYFTTIKEGETAKEVLDAILARGEAIGFQLDGLKQLAAAEQEAVMELFVENRAEAPSVEALQAVLDEAVMIERIRISGGDQQIFDEYEPVLKLKESAPYQSYEEDLQIVKADGWYERTAEQAKTASTTEELQQIAQEQLLLHLIQTAGVWHTTKKIVEKDYALLGLTAAEISNVSDTVYSKVHGKDYETIEEFENAFMLAKGTGSSGQGPSGSRPSGGNSSGNNSGTSIPSGSLIIDDNEPGQQEPEQEKFLFEDVKASAAWAGEAVAALYEKGVINGKTETEFAPNDPITREEFTTLVVNMCGLQTGVVQGSFTDVPADAWYAPYVAAAYENGLVSGIDAERFGTGLNITRQDMAVIIARAISAGEGSVDRFADSAEIADYAKDAVGYLAANGVINGKEDQRFCPADYATRAEAAQMIYKAMQLKQWI